MHSKKKEIVEIEIPSKTIRLKNAMCRNGHNLMDEENLINDSPAITVLAKYGEQEGLIHLDPVYGSFQNLWEITVPAGECVELFCPTCKVSLSDHDKFATNVSRPCLRFICRMAAWWRRACETVVIFIRSNSPIRTRWRKSCSKTTILMTCFDAKPRVHADQHGRVMFFKLK